MLALQGAGRTKKIYGRKPDGATHEIIDLLCTRKHVIDDNGWNKVQSVKNLFAFVSSPTIYEQEGLRKLVKAWCHGFKKPDTKLPKDVPQILLPESDFQDQKFIYSRPLRERYKYDYFYFTINNKSGVNHKGLNVFLDSLPILCKHKLKGLVVVYYPNGGVVQRFKVKFTPERNENLEKYQDYLHFHWGLLKKIQMNEVMKFCRFGFFPNTVDNSPRLISEALVRNVPILVNKSIHGGWHYVNNHTGALFKLKNLDKKIDFIMSSKFSPNEYFHTHYGFERSTKKLCDFLSSVFGYKEWTHMYFNNFAHYLDRIK